jgi:hypothetical protein
MAEAKKKTQEALTFAELQAKMQISKKSKQGVKFTFRNAEDIETHFKTLKSGWYLNLTDRLLEVAGRLFVVATVTVSNGEETHSSEGLAELDTVPVMNNYKGGQSPQMAVPQWTGAVSSYARKYALQGLFAIGEEDVDSYTIGEEEPLTLTFEQLAELDADINAIAATAGGQSANIRLKLQGYIGVNDLAEIYQPNFLTAKNYLAALMNKAVERAGREKQPAKQSEIPTDAPVENKYPEPFDINNI